MREAEYLNEVYRLAKDAGAIWHHCGRSYTCEGKPGLPDLLIVGTRGCLFREVKASFGDKPSPEQTAWRWLLISAGQDAKVWTSEDLLTGVVAREIARIA